MSWGAQNRSKDARTPSAAGGRSENPERDLWPIPPYCAAIGVDPKAPIKARSPPKATKAAMNPRRTDTADPTSLTETGIFLQALRFNQFSVRQLGAAAARAA
jgi:hypothetical protein